jgi:NADH-quinone oxidoreductase E subunit
MSDAQTAPVEQPESFAFLPENLAKAEAAIAKFPPGRQASAVLPLLHLAQKQAGWLPRAAMEEVARLLGLAPIRVYEVASFYTMFNLRPVGRHLIQVCRTTPCWLRGADKLTEACGRRLGVGMREVTGDGLFSFMEVECLGACSNAPAVQIDDDYYEDLTPEALEAIIAELAAGRRPKPGSQTGRQGSAPEGSATTLREIAPPGGAGE